MMSTWLPTKKIPSLKSWWLALIIMGIMAASMAVTIFFAGAAMIVPASLGAINVTGLFLRPVPVSAKAAFTAILSVSAGLASYVGPDLVCLPLITGLTALAVVPFTAKYGSVALSAPLVPAFIGIQQKAVGLPGTTMLAIALSAVMIGLLLPITKMSLPREKVAWPVAWVHGILLAVLTAAGMGVALSQGWGHGAWLLIGICMVLLPVHQDRARKEGVARVVGSIAGAILAMTLSLVSIQPVFLLAVAAVAYTAAMAYSVEANQPVFITFLTLGVIMVAATGVIGPIWTLAVERMVLITAGAAVALCGTECVLQRMKRA